MIFNNQPKESKKLSRNKICENCAWTPDPHKFSKSLDDNKIDDKLLECNNTDFNGIAKYKVKYYCYFFEKYFFWIRSGKDSVYYLGMKPCKKFTDLLPPEESNLERGIKFANFSFYKTSIKRSFWALIISIISLTVSIALKFFDVFKQSITQQ